MRHNIVKDIKKVFQSAHTIFEKKGVIVPGLGSRSGKRFIPTQNDDIQVVTPNWGGKRERKIDLNLYEIKDVPEDARDAYKLFMKKTDVKFERDNNDNASTGRTASYR